jgi:hypothetical protein
MNILQVFKVKVVDTRLVLNWTPSSTTCSTSDWLLLNCHWLLLKPCVGIENMFCLTWVHWLVFTVIFIDVQKRSMLHLGVLTLTFFKGGPTDPSVKWKRASNSIQDPILAHFKLKFCWKKLFPLIVTSIIQWRKFEITIEAIIETRVLFLASEYVSKQVRVVPSINRPTRVNPSVFCSLKKEPWLKPLLISCDLYYRRK